MTLTNRTINSVGGISHKNECLLVAIWTREQILHLVYGSDNISFHGPYHYVILEEFQVCKSYGTSNITVNEVYFHVKFGHAGPMETVFFSYKVFGTKVSLRTYPRTNQACWSCGKSDKSMEIN